MDVLQELMQMLQLVDHAILIFLVVIFAKIPHGVMDVQMVTTWI